MPIHYAPLDVRTWALASISSLRMRLRSEGHQDVLLVVAAGRAGLELVDPDDGADEPCVELDAPARTLVIWGRRPDQRGRFRSHMPTPTLTRMQALLAGY